MGLRLRLPATSKVTATQCACNLVSGWTPVWCSSSKTEALPETKVFGCLQDMRPRSGACRHVCLSEFLLVPAHKPRSSALFGIGCWEGVFLRSTDRLSLWLVLYLLSLGVLVFSISL